MICTDKFETALQSCSLKDRLNCCAVWWCMCEQLKEELYYAHECFKVKILFQKGTVWGSMGDFFSPICLIHYPATNITRYWSDICSTPRSNFRTAQHSNPGVTTFPSADLPEMWKRELSELSEIYDVLPCRNINDLMTLFSFIVNSLSGHYASK